MFATSQTDKSKAQAVSDSVKKALEGQSFNSVVKVILGGTIDHTGPGQRAKEMGPAEITGRKPATRNRRPRWWS